jgi:ATP-dependent DNA ligase
MASALSCIATATALSSYRAGAMYSSHSRISLTRSIANCGATSVLDGEIVCLDKKGRSQFNELLFRRGDSFFYAFDILWDAGIMSADEEENRASAMA